MDSETDNNKKFNSRPFILLLVILIIAVLVWIYKPSSSIIKANVKAIAPTGTLIAGFYPGLILVSDANISLSEQTVMTTGQNTVDALVTRYTTHAETNALFNAYIDYAKNNGYQVIKNTLNDSRQGQIVAGKNLEILLISLTPVNKNTQSVEIYVEKPA